jgi:hypothetical protein
MSSSAAGTHQGNYGPYLILDKMLWQPPNAGTRGVAGFLRIGSAPGDRNLLNLEIVSRRRGSTPPKVR